jgi:hypothetical protein
MKCNHVFFILVSDIVAIYNTTIEMGPLPRSGLRKKGISTQRESNSKHPNDVATLE